MGKNPAQTSKRNQTPYPDNYKHTTRPLSTKGYLKPMPCATNIQLISVSNSRHCPNVIGYPRFMIHEWSQPQSLNQDPGYNLARRGRRRRIYQRRAMTVTAMKRQRRRRENDGESDGGDCAEENPQFLL